MQSSIAIMLDYFNSQFFNINCSLFLTNYYQMLIVLIAFVSKVTKNIRVSLIFLFLKYLKMSYIHKINKYTQIYFDL